MASSFLNPHAFPFVITRKPNTSARVFLFPLSLFSFFGHFFLILLFLFVHLSESDDKSPKMPLPKIFAPKNDRGKNQSWNQALAPAVARSAYSANQAPAIAGAGHAYSACHAKCAYDAKKQSGKNEKKNSLRSKELFVLSILFIILLKIQFQYSLLTILKFFTCCIKPRHFG